MGPRQLPQVPARLVQCVSRQFPSTFANMSTGVSAHWEDHFVLTPLSDHIHSYYEAIDILYTRNTFDIRRVDTFISLHKSIIPQRSNSIRCLNLRWHFERNFFATLRPWFKQIRHDRSRWEEGCAALKNMTGLWDLTLSLHVNWAKKDAKSAVRLLEPLKEVTVRNLFEVIASWPATANEAEVRFLSEKLPFRLVRDEGMAMSYWSKEHKD